MYLYRKIFIKLNAENVNIQQQCHKNSKINYYTSIENDASSINCKHNNIIIQKNILEIEIFICKYYDIYFISQFNHKYSFVLK